MNPKYNRNNQRSCKEHTRTIKDSTLDAILSKETRIKRLRDKTKY